MVAQATLWTGDLLIFLSRFGVEFLSQFIRRADDDSPGLIACPARFGVKLIDRPVHAL